MEQTRSSGGLHSPWETGLRFRWVFPAVAGALWVAVVWCVANVSSVENGLGSLERRGFPASNFYLCVAAGGLLGAASGMLEQQREAKASRRLSKLAESLGFDYRDRLSLEDLGPRGRLPLLQGWRTGAHCMTGVAEGVAVVMLDCTLGEPDGDTDDDHSQTMVVTSLTDCRVPGFALRPRQLGMKLAATLTGRMATNDALVVEGGLLSHDQSAASRDFSRRYHLSPVAMDPDGIPDGHADEGSIPAAHAVPTDQGVEHAIRGHFDRLLLHFFAEHPGWTVQSNGRFLAVCRRGSVATASAREAFLRDALNIHEAVTAAATRRERS